MEPLSAVFCQLPREFLTRNEHLEYGSAGSPPGVFGKQSTLTGNQTKLEHATS